MKRDTRFQLQPKEQRNLVIVNRLAHPLQEMGFPGNVSFGGLKNHAVLQLLDSYEPIGCPNDWP